jgi:glycosyltransferase involved in cell wall biosynthesis
MPRNKKQPFILTIHDINFIYEEPINFKTKALIQKRINRANAIVYVSHFTMQEVNKHFDISQKTIQKVIYNGNSLKGIQSVKNEQTSSKYLFSITEMRPYKNLDKLIEMMVFLPEDYKLILAGKGSEDYITYLNEIIVKNNLNNRIVLKGVISEEEKIELLNNCCAFVFPSSREGFGLPVVEALNFNKPIFLYHKTSLPEIGGDACFYWYNLDDKYMAKKVIEKLGYYNENKDEIHNKISQQLVKFDWDKAAQLYEEIYSQYI